MPQAAFSSLLFIFRSPILEPTVGAAVFIPIAASEEPNHPAADDGDPHGDGESLHEEGKGQIDQHEHSCQAYD
jgi:hypothetical protein